MVAKNEIADAVGNAMIKVHPNQFIHWNSLISFLTNAGWTKYKNSPTSTNVAAKIPMNHMTARLLKLSVNTLFELTIFFFYNYLSISEIDCCFSRKIFFDDG